MKIEVPELKKCCCCIPLRYGLLFWVYMNLVITVLLFFFFLSVLIMFSSSDLDSYRSICIGIILIVLLIDISSCILFLVSTHKKNHQYMKIYYKYAIGILIMEVIFLLGNTAVDTYRLVFIADLPFHIYQYLGIFSFTFAVVAFQAYLVILVRSEVLKLQRSTKIEFINHNNEPESKAEIVL